MEAGRRMLVHVEIDQDMTFYLETEAEFMLARWQGVDRSLCGMA